MRKAPPPLTVCPYTSERATTTTRRRHGAARALPLPNAPSGSYSRPPLRRIDAGAAPTAACRRGARHPAPPTPITPAGVVTDMCRRPPPACTRTLVFTRCSLSVCSLVVSLGLLFVVAFVQKYFLTVWRKIKIFMPFARAPRYRPHHGRPSHGRRWPRWARVRRRPPRRRRRRSRRVVRTRRSWRVYS
jgi:hypothetical protein